MFVYNHMPLSVSSCHVLLGGDENSNSYSVWNKKISITDIISELLAAAVIKFLVINICLVSNQLIETLWLEPTI